MVLVIIGEDTLDTHWHDALLTKSLYVFMLVTFTTPLRGNHFGKGLLYLKTLA